MGKGNQSGPGTTLAKVNGDEIENADFKSQEDLLKQTSQRQIDPDQLSTYVWQMMVSKTVMGQEYKKLGLIYTDKEYGEDITGNEPPDTYRNQFTNQQTGQYDATEVTNAIANLKRSPNSQQAVMFQKVIVEPGREEGLSKKYQALVTGAVYVPKWMADKTVADNSSIANISYVSVPYTSVADSTIKVSDDDVNDYVKRHAKEFELKDETRQVAYVTFDAYPSRQDTTTIIGQLEALKGEFNTATDIKTFLEEKGSGVNYYDGFLSKTQMHQVINDTLFKMKPGQMFGPYKDGGSYALAKMIDEKQMPDSATVRHILVATHQQDQQTGQLQRYRDDSTARKRLDSAVAEIKAGKNFDSVCLKYSDDGTKATGGVYKYFPTGQMMESFNDFAFGGKTGDKKVVQTPYGFHYVEILGQKGSDPAYKIAYFSKPVIVSQETDDSAKNAASQFAGTAHNLKDFYANAAKAGKTPFSIPGIKENDNNVGGGPNGQGGLGKSRQFVRWIYQADLGDISDAQRFEQKYVVAIVTAVNKPGLPSAETTRPIVEPKIRNEKKAKILIDTKIKGTTLEAIAQSSGTAVQQADSLSFQFRSQIGRSVIAQEPMVLGAAFNKTIQGKVSAPIAGEAGVYVIKGNGIAGVAPALGGAQQQRTMAELNLKRGQQSAMQALVKAATIKDYRSKFF